MAAAETVAALLRQHELERLEDAFENIGLLDVSRDAVLAAGSVCLKAMLEEEEIPTNDVKAVIKILFGAPSRADSVNLDEVADEDTAVGDAMQGFLGGFADSDEEERASASSVEEWGHDACLEFFKSLPREAGPIVVDPDIEYSGAELLAALDSVRELKHLGLTTPRQRMMFEKALSARINEAFARVDGACAGTAGGLYSKEFLDVTRPLYEMCMGVENMAPLL